MGEGGQALDVNAEQARERVGLCVTELGKLCCDVLHRAMPLTQLHAGHRRAHSDRTGGRGEALGGQGRRQRLGTCGDVPACVGELHGIPGFHVVVAFLGELAHRILAGMILKKAQRRGRDMVAVAAHANMTGLGQDVCAGWTTTTTAERTSADGLMLLDGTLFDKMVKVTADGGGSQPQTRGKSRRGDRAMLGDRLPDPVPGARLKTVLAGVEPVSRVENAVGCDKHNTSVT
jgi:hypothetical protein